MSREYAEKRIRDALKQAKGNATKAQRQVIAWATSDMRLLLALCQPHLTGIVAHAVNRVIHRQEAEDHAPEIPDMPQSLNMGPETFGKEILRALQSNNTAQFGREESAAPVSKKQASQSHIEAMKKLARKKKDD
jgi:hypothetical protein